jgi:hypothetical protein
MHMTQRLEDIRPLARKQELIIQHLDDEVLVYDRKNDRAHCLNSTAALIWQNCDGKTSFSQLARLVRRNSLSYEVAEKIVWLALGQLSRKALLQEPQSFTHSSLISRRALVRVLGMTAAALPLVVSIVSPTAVEAATCLNPGQACTTSAECCSGVCNTATTGTCA